MSWVLEIIPAVLSFPPLFNSVSGKYDIFYINNYVLSTWKMSTTFLGKSSGTKKHLRTFKWSFQAGHLSQNDL